MHCRLHLNLRSSLDRSPFREDILHFKDRRENGHLLFSVSSIPLIRIQRKSSADIRHQSGCCSITTELTIHNLIPLFSPQPHPGEAAMQLSSIYRHSSTNGKWVVSGKRSRYTTKTVKTSPNQNKKRLCSLELWTKSSFYSSSRVFIHI